MATSRNISPVEAYNQASIWPFARFSSKRLENNSSISDDTSISWVSDNSLENSNYAIPSTLPYAAYSSISHYQDKAPAPLSTPSNTSEDQAASFDHLQYRNVSGVAYLDASGDAHSGGQINDIKSIHWASKAFGKPEVNPFISENDTTPHADNATVRALSSTNPDLNTGLLTPADSDDEDEDELANGTGNPVSYASKFNLQARQSFAARRGLFWNSAVDALKPFLLHPVQLTEEEYLGLVLSEDCVQWLKINLVHSSDIIKRSVDQLVAAHTKLLDHDITPKELRRSDLNAFETMLPEEQDYFIEQYKLLRGHVILSREGLYLNPYAFQTFLTMPVAEQTQYLERLKDQVEKDVAWREARDSESKEHDEVKMQDDAYSFETSDVEGPIQLDALSFSAEKVDGRNPDRSTMLGTVESKILEDFGFVKTNIEDILFDKDAETMFKLESHQSSPCESDDNIDPLNTPSGYRFKRASPVQAAGSVLDSSPRALKTLPEVLGNIKANTFSSYGITKLRKTKKSMQGSDEYDENNATVTPARNRIRKSISKLFGSIRVKGRSEEEFVIGTVHKVGGLVDLEA